MSLRLAAFAAALSLAASGGAGAEPPGQAQVRLITLGTNGGAIPHPGRAQPANLLEVDGRPYLIDAGSGVVRQLTLAGVPLTRVREIFITHHHIDHSADWALLMGHAYVVGQRDPITTFGPPGTVHMRDAFLGFLEPVAATTGRPPPPRPVLEAVFRARDVVPGQVFADDRVRVTAVENCHYHLPPGPTLPIPPRSYGYRFEARGKVVVFSGDTGPCEDRLAPFAKAADLLVHEVIDVPAMLALLKAQPGLSYTPSEWAVIEAHMREDHTTPEQVGRLATRAGVRKVVLTHVVPGTGDPEVYAAGVRRFFSGPVVVAQDLQVFE